MTGAPRTRGKFITDRYEPWRYWHSVAGSLNRPGCSPLAAVLYTNAPIWLNRLVDRDQERAIARALRRCPPLAGAEVLDVGAGIGRWSARLTRHGASVTSLDLTSRMLRHGVHTGAVKRPVTGTAVQLPFHDASFDFVQSITVLQHLPAEHQAAAIAELVRVCRPGGAIFLVELIDSSDVSPIVVPRPIAWWQDQLTRQNLPNTYLGGQEFQPLDRSLRRIRRWFERRGDAPPAASPHQPAGRRLVGRMVMLLNGISYLAEPALAAVLPAGWARHGVFVFRKPLAAPGQLVVDRPQ